jgi:DUF4097 and DUF4098 domain-containing protein YvlB
MKRAGFLFLIATLGVMVSGCFFSYILEVPETRTWLEDEGITEIAVSTPNGKITVSSTTATTTTALITRKCSGMDREDAEKYIGNVKITEDITGGKLSLGANTPVYNVRNYAADFEITTPESNILDLATTNGSVNVTGMTARAKIRMTNGKIVTNNHSGEIDAVTMNGNVDCDISTLTAAVSLDTTNGNVTLSLPASASASFDSSTTNGYVTVTGFSPDYSMEYSTRKVGTIGTGPSYTSVTLNSTNGNVTIQAR